MRVIIDIIEDIREEIANSEDFTIYAMLLKEDSKDSKKLINAGEAKINSFNINSDEKKLLFYIDTTDNFLTIGELIPNLLILSMDSMMYEIKLNINFKYSNVEVIGFGKSIEDKKYFLFIKP